MRITVFSPHIWPDTAPTGEVTRRLVEHWAGAGHECHVVSTLPWYSGHRVEPKWRGCMWHRQVTGWGTVLRLHPCAPRSKSSLTLRAAGAAAFGAYAAVAGLGALPPGDVVFAMSPPLTLAAAASAVARRHRLPLVLNLQDLHPDAAVATGAVTARTPLRALRALERRTYRDASAITTLSPAMARTVAERAPAGKRIEVIANFVDTAAVTPGPRMNDFRRELGVPESAVLFMYAGNVGLSQPMELIRFAANRLRLRRDVCFAVNGAGVAMADVERWAAEHANVVVSGYQPGERLGEVLAAADVHLVLLRPGMGNVSVPSKVYTALAAGRPVLAAVDADSEVRRIVDDAGAGTTVDPGDPQAFVDAVLRLADDADGRTAMGDAAREHSRRHTPAGAAAAYLRLFEEVAFAGR